MAQYSPGFSSPVPPTQNANNKAQLVDSCADWNGIPSATPYPTTQDINNLSGSTAAPQAVLCQTADGVTGYVIWHGAPEAFPQSIYPASQPPQGMAFTPMRTPTPDRRRRSAQRPQSFIAQSDPRFGSAHFPVGTEGHDGGSVASRKDMPRVVPMPSAEELRSMCAGQRLGQLGATSGTPAAQTGPNKIIHPRPISGADIRAINLLTQPRTSREPSYVLGGTENKPKNWEFAIVDDDFSIRDIFQDPAESSTSREDTTLDSSPPVPIYSVATTSETKKSPEEKKTPVKRSIAATCNVRPRKKGRMIDAATTHPASDNSASALGSPSASVTIINARKGYVDPQEGTTQRSTSAEGDALDKEFMQFKQMMMDAGMDDVFDCDLASDGWQEEPFWINEDPTQTSEQGHLLTRFRKLEDLSFNLNPWDDDELPMPFPAAL
ncbi:MAG: hypothetical protein M1830_004784 [Pleopsidium flavum]|nr:MAG: hypothetical protein M1830_004784 [Pleopsidium flavum]